MPPLVSVIVDTIIHLDSLFFVIGFSAGVVFQALVALAWTVYERSRA